MSDLRDAVIKLAYEKPELRNDLLPLVKTADDERLVEFAMEEFNDVFGNFRNKPRATWRNTEIMDIDVTEGYRETNVEFHAEVTLKKSASEAVEWLNDEIKRGNLKVFNPSGTKVVTERMLKKGIDVWDNWSISLWGSREILFSATLHY